jgi:purine-binding chemotaxis protein CheW
VENFQALLKKAGGEMFWSALFSQPLHFKNEPCVLTVIYDLTERRQAEEEIRRLTEELEKRKELAEKYLMFMLAGQEYGILLVRIKELIGMTEITPVPGTPAFVKGVINLRGKVIPVADLRLRLGLDSADYAERTCIIVSDIEIGKEKQLMGMIADSVTQVIGIRGKDIEPAPEFNRNTDIRFIAGMAKIGGSVKILLDTSRLWEGM